MTAAGESPRARGATLAAAVSRILPPNEEHPTADEAGVTSYVAEAAAEAPSRLLQVWAQGLDMLEDMARARHGRGFAACPPHWQDEVLVEIQRVPHPLMRRFFDLLIDWTLEGWLCDPRHGGNRDRAGWRMVGYQPK